MGDFGKLNTYITVYGKDSLLEVEEQGGMTTFSFCYHTKSTYAYWLRINIVHKMLKEEAFNNSRFQY